MKSPLDTPNNKLVKENEIMTNPFGAPDDQQEEFAIELPKIESSVPEGKYVGRLVDVEKSISKAGNSMWVWTFVIDEGTFSGMEFKLFTALTPSAMWKLTETLVALGFGGYGQVIKFKLTDVINTRVILHIIEDTYNDQPRPSLNKISKIGD